MLNEGRELYNDTDLVYVMGVQTFYRKMATPIIVDWFADRSAKIKSVVYYCLNYCYFKIYT